MKNCDVDEEALQRGDYCNKKAPGCFCRVGYPIERTCSDCRHLRFDNGIDNRSFCICSPTDDRWQHWQKEKEAPK